MTDHQRGIEAAIRKAGQVAIDHLIDTCVTYEATNDDLADYLTRVVDACVRAALAKPVAEAVPHVHHVVLGETSKAIALGAAVLTRIEDPAVREIAIRNALTEAAKAMSENRDPTEAVKVKPLEPSRAAALIAMINERIGSQFDDEATFSADEALLIMSALECVAVLENGGEDGR